MTKGILEKVEGICEYVIDHRCHCFDVDCPHATWHTLKECSSFGLCIYRDVNGHKPSCIDREEFEERKIGNKGW